MRRRLRQRHTGERWIRRWLSAVLAVGGVVSFVVALVGPVSPGANAQDADSARPDVFRSAAESLVVEFSLDRDALLPVPDVFRFMVVEGRGAYESSSQTAQASLFYPGNGVVAGPNLVCGTFGGQFPPEFEPVIEACSAFRFPLSVRADSLEPHEASTGATQIGERGDPISAEAASAVARAGPDAATSDAVMSSLRLLGLPAVGSLDTILPAGLLPVVDDSVLTIDSASSRTRQRIDDGTLVVEAESTLSGVRLIGGLIEIASLRSVAVVTDDGRDTMTHDAALDIGGVTVGGVPARITENGLELGSPTGTQGPLTDQLTQLLNQLVDGLGITVATLEVTDGVDEHGSAFARVGGVLVEYGIDVEGLPTVPGPMGDIDLSGFYRGSIVLGQAGAVGQAAYIDVPPFEPPPVVVADRQPPVAAASPPTPAPPAAAPPLAPGGSSAAPEEIAAPIAAPELIRVLTFEHLIEGRLRLVYLGMALLALAACVAPRFTFPARLPGAAS